MMLSPSNPTLRICGTYFSSFRDSGGAETGLPAANEVPAPTGVVVPAPVPVPVGEAGLARK